MLLNLFEKFIAGIKEAETVIVGFGDKLDASGFGQGIKGADDFGAVFLELFDDHAGDAEGNLKASFIAANHLQQKPVRGQVALVGDLAADGGVFEFVEVIS